MAHKNGDEDEISAIRALYQNTPVSEEHGWSITVQGVKILILGKPESSSKYTIINGMIIGPNILTKMLQRFADIIVPLFGLEFSSNGVVEYSHSVDFDTVMVFVDVDPPSHEHGVTLTIQDQFRLINNIQEDYSGLFLNEAGENAPIACQMSKERVFKALLSNGAASAGEVLYNGTKYSVTDTCSDNNIIVYLNPDRKLAVACARREFTVNSLTFGQKMRFTFMKAQRLDVIRKEITDPTELAERYVCCIVNKYVNFLILTPIGSIILRNIQRIFHDRDEDETLTLVFTNQVLPTEVKIQIGGELQYEASCDDDMGKMVLQTYVDRRYVLRGSMVG